MAGPISPNRRNKPDGFVGLGQGDHKPADGQFTDLLAGSFDNQLESVGQLVQFDPILGHVGRRHDRDMDE